MRALRLASRAAVALLGRAGIAVPLSPADSTAVQPSYSWDGARIAFASDRAWDTPRLTVETLWAVADPVRRFVLDIFVMGADGAAPVRVTTGKSADRRPCFSPDGGTVAFVSDRSDNSDLWLAAVAPGSGEPGCLEVAAQGWDPRRPLGGGRGGGLRWRRLPVVARGRSRSCDGGGRDRAD